MRACATPCPASAACWWWILDVIGNCLTELNVSSPTSSQAIRQQAGFDMVKMFSMRWRLRLGLTARDRRMRQRRNGNRRPEASIV
jgi:hypothetical protein